MGGFFLGGVGGVTWRLSNCGNALFDIDRLFLTSSARQPLELMELLINRYNMEPPPSCNTIEKLNNFQVRCGCALVSARARARVCVCV